MINTIACPHATSWCTEHSEDIDQCVSESFDLQGGKISLWLLAEIPGLEPTISVDAAPSGGGLPLSLAGELRAAVQSLEDLALKGRQA